MVPKVRLLGFTLVELLVVVALLTILLLLGVSSYRNYLQDSSARQAALVLLKDVEYLEKYQALCGNYAADTASTASPPCLIGSVVAARVAWPSLPYVYSPESGTAWYRIRFSSSLPSPCSSANSCSGVNNYRLIAEPICNTLTADDNQCSCVDSAGNAQSGNLNCNICVDQDSNIIYNANSNCGN